MISNIYNLKSTWNEMATSTTTQGFTAAKIFRQRTKKFYATDSFAYLKIFLSLCLLFYHPNQSWKGYLSDKSVCVPFLQNIFILHDIFTINIISSIRHCCLLALASNDSKKRERENTIQWDYERKSFFFKFFIPSLFYISAIQICTLNEI